MNIYVGNLAYSVTGDHLKEAFAPFGAVTTANVIIDRATGQSKGFGFVEMPSNSEAENAISSLNDQPLAGRKMRINEARPREDRPAKPPRARY
jgi:RNA recognition motif-containing protein